MVSYFKTQWFRLLVAIICLVIACYYAFQPAADPMTMEGLNKTLSDIVNANLYFTSFIIWAFMSVIEYNNDRIELLEKKAEKYDALVKEVSALYDLINAEKRYSELLDQQVRMLAEEIQKRR